MLSSERSGFEKYIYYLLDLDVIIIIVLLLYYYY